MDISPVYVVLTLAGLLVGCLIFRYLKLVIHIVVLLAKLVPLALAAFAVVYLTGLWRPDLSPLLWLISKVLDSVGLSG
jgi:hypothetical protein